MVGRSTAFGHAVAPGSDALGQRLQRNLYNWSIDTLTMPGHTLLRADGGQCQHRRRRDANSSAGRPTATARNRLTSASSTATARSAIASAGNFVYHPTHHHFHFEKLRRVRSAGAPRRQFPSARSSPAGAKPASAWKMSMRTTRIFPARPSRGVHRVQRRASGRLVGWADVTLPSSMANGWTSPACRMGSTGFRSWTIRRTGWWNRMKQTTPRGSPSICM